MRLPLRMGLDVCAGSHVALITPFSTDFSIDEPELRALLRWHLSEGTDGIVALGTTGEASVLSDEERAQVIRACVEEVGGKIPITVGVGSIDPRTAISNARAACRLGADACMVVTPPYVKPPQRGLVQYFKAVADECELPILLYNVPGRTGVDMRPETIAEASQHPRIVGVKEATGDISRVKPIVRDAAPGFLVLGGDDAAARELTLAGGHGVVSVTANVAPRLMASVIAAARVSDASQASMIDKNLGLLHSALFIESNPIPVKYALARMGKIGTPTMRLPLVELATEHHAALDAALVAGGCIS